MQNNVEIGFILFLNANDFIDFRPFPGPIQFFAFLSLNAFFNKKKTW